MKKTYVTPAARISFLSPLDLLAASGEPAITPPDNNSDPGKPDLDWE